MSSKRLALIILIVVIILVGAYLIFMHPSTNGGSLFSSGNTASSTTATTTTTSTTGGTTSGSSGGTASTPASKDQALRTALASLMTHALVYDKTFNTYGPSQTAGCASIMQASGVFSDQTVQADLVKALANSSSMTCKIYDNGKSYAVSGKLNTSDTNSYCVDSTGYAGNVTGNVLIAPNAGCAK